MKPLLLCTDLDRTLIPNGDEAESPDARRLFAQCVASGRVKLAYVSGRNLALIKQAMTEWHLPLPDIAIADVGSTIYRREQHGWRQWQAWDDEISGDWAGMSCMELHHLLDDISPLRIQEQNNLNRHKLSYYLPLETDPAPVLAAVEARLAHHSIRANLIWSVDAHCHRASLLDVLPAKANKLHAIRFLMQQDGFDAGHTLFAGDSGNDLDVLLSEIPSVLVANGDAETRRAVAQAASSSHQVYVASGGLMGMNGCYSAGILEGLVHYHPDAAAGCDLG